VEISPISNRKGSFASTSPLIDYNKEWKKAKHSRIADSTAKSASWQ
jgi:hypothetical protein